MAWSVGSDVVNAIARMVIVACVLGVGSAAARPDRIGQATGAVTALGKRLAPVARATDGRPTEATWRRAAALIAAANAEADARADAAAGHAGLMTHANDTTAERAFAPGTRCHDRSEPARRAVFHFAYTTPLTPAAGQALLAFDSYARAYNAAVIASGTLGETSCAAAGG